MKSSIPVESICTHNHTVSMHGVCVCVLTCILLTLGEVLYGAASETRRSSFYREMQYTHSNSGSSMEITGTVKASCVQYCTSYAWCHTADYNFHTQTCKLLNITVFNSTFLPFCHVNSSLLYRVPGRVEHNGLTLVYRMQSLSRISVYDTWKNPGGSGNSLLYTDPGCLRTDTIYYCGSFYRSGILDKWENSNIQKVHVKLFTLGSEVLSLTFDAIGSSYMNWFSDSRLLSHPWTDQVSEMNANGAEGIDEHLRFSVWQNVNCNIGKGWFSVMDSATVTFCNYFGSDYPLFYYSTGRYDFWTDLQEAQVMTVYVELAI